MPKIRRNLSTPEGRKFWESTERIAAQTHNWPDSRKAGINVSAKREPTTTDGAVYDLLRSVGIEGGHVYTMVQDLVARYRAEQDRAELAEARLEDAGIQLPEVE